MRYKELLEALKPSQYRPLVKNWDKERYASIFLSDKYEHDKNGYRVYIPLGEVNVTKKSTIQKDVEKELQKNGFELEDYKTGLALNKKNNQKIKIGKVLNKFNPDLLNKFTSDNSREAVNNRYIVVISRHPYDIAGMSTNRGWTSCMNLEDGINRHFVPLDIKEGTIVAYVTKENDRNLENPTGRIAIKPFINILDTDKKDFIYLGIENKVYGTNVPEFKNIVKKWVDQINKSHKLDSIAVVSINPALYNDSHASKKVIGGSKKEQKELKEIINNPSNIKNINNPSENMILAAVSKDGLVIQYIKDPNEKAKLTAVKQNGYAISFIKNPSEDIQLAAARQQGMAIRYIKNPSIEVQLSAVNQDVFSIRYITNPSEDIQLEAVNQNPFSIDWIRNPSEKAKLTAVKNDWRAIRYIKDPSEDIQLAAVKQNKDAIWDIINPTSKVIQASRE